VIVVVSVTIHPTGGVCVRMSLSQTVLLKHNLRRVQDRIAAACLRANRSVNDVTLVAVTKYAELDWVRSLMELGVTNLGENRPQQLVARAGQMSPAVRWHQIGHLQTNKADTLLPFVDLIHSVDSLRLAQHLASCAGKRGLRPRVLLEVNLLGEATKDGFSAEELTLAWPSIVSQPSIAVEGLMTMAPLNQDPESARSVFRDLRELRDHLRASDPSRGALKELSMGMSGDFEVAIEEGATLIRLGSCLFEGLLQP